MTRQYIWISVTLGILWLAANVTARESSSYAVSAEALDAGYGLAASTSYRNLGSVGSIGGFVDSTAYTIESGYPAQAGDLPAPVISIEQPLTSVLADGDSRALGVVFVDASTSEEFTIRNTGTADLTLGSISTDGTHSGDFSASALGNTTVAPGDSITLTVTYSPIASGARSAAMHLPSNATGAANPFDILLSGTAVLGFSHWGSDAALGEGDAAGDAIPFADGVENLLKYAFNMNGAAPDVRVLTAGGAAGLPYVSFDGSGAQPLLRVEFVRRKNSGLTYTAQWTSDLMADFGSMSGTPLVTSIDVEWERVVVTEPVSIVSVPSAFARVEVSE